MRQGPAMTTIDTGTKLVALIKAGKNHEAIEALYAPDIVSVEAMSRAGESTEVTGIAACLGKGKQFRERMEVHALTVEGPFPHGDRFAIFLSYEATPKAGGARTTMKEIAVYTVVHDKIAKEEFFYGM
jgi:hypothetical protein